VGAHGHEGARGQGLHVGDQLRRQRLLGLGLQVGVHVSDEERGGAVDGVEAEGGGGAVHQQAVVRVDEVHETPGERRRLQEGGALDGLDEVVEAVEVGKLAPRRRQGGEETSSAETLEVDLVLPTLLHPGAEQGAEVVAALDQEGLVLGEAGVPDHHGQLGRRPAGRTPSVFGVLRRHCKFSDAPEENKLRENETRS